MQRTSHGSTGPSARPRRRAVRFLAIGAAATLVMGAAAACGESKDATKDADQKALASGDKLEITTFGEFGYDELIEQWNSEHPDLQVHQTKVTKWDDWKTEVGGDLQAGSGLPDVVAVEGDYMPALVANPNAWVDLSQPEVEGRWLDYKVEAATTPDDKLLGYATDSGPEAICYNAGLFKKAGLPTDRAAVAKLMTTWDDYFALGEKFHAKVPDAAWYDASGSIAQAMLNQIRYPFEKADNTVAVDNPELRKVFDTVAKYHDTLSTKVPQWDADWTAGFQKNKIATIPCPGWMRSNIVSNLGDPVPAGADWDIADVFPGGGGNWGGSYLTIPKMSSHQKEALEFITWLTAPEQTAQIFESYGNFPSQVEALSDPKVLNYKDPDFNDAPAGKIFSARAKAIEVQPYHGPLYSDILAKFQDAINRVDQGKKPDDSWKTFLTEVEALK